MNITILLTVLIGGVAQAQDSGTETCVIPEGALLPDLLTVVPNKLQLQDAQQNEVLRFTNGMANLGAGLWMMEPEISLDADSTIATQGAYQVFMDRVTGVNGAVLPASNLDGYLGRCKVGEFEYHTTHNHWHIESAADYRICSRADFDTALAAGTPESCTPVGQGQKTTFCLIDWVKLGDNNPASDPLRSFFSCYSSFQGVSPGYYDQYHQATDMQELDITGAPDGDYVLVSTVAPDGNYIEGAGSTTSTGGRANNSAWTYFTLEPQGEGNRVVTVTGNACDEADFSSRLELDILEHIGYSGTTISVVALASDMCGGVSANR